MPVAKQILKAGDDVAMLHESNGVVKGLPQAETKRAENESIQNGVLEGRARKWREGEREDAVLGRLDHASLELDHYALKCLLELAVQAGISREKLEGYRRVFTDMHNDAFVQAELEKLVMFLGKQRGKFEKLSRPEKRFFLVRGNNLVRNAKRMGMGNSVLVQEMVKCVQENL